MRYKVCFVVTSPITALTFLPGYLRKLRQKGWDVTLMCSPSTSLSELARSEGINLREIPMSRNPSPLADAISLARLTLAVRRLRPDALIYATPKASLLSSIASRLAGVPVRIYELWGLRLEGSTGPTKIILLIMEWLTCRLSTEVIANSPSLAKKATTLGANGGKHIVCIGSGSSHGVDVQKYSHASPTSPLDRETREYVGRESAPTVGYVGRLHPDKGVDVLLDAGAILLSQGFPVRLLLVGPDEGALQRDQLSLPENFIHLVGPTSDPRPYYKEMDILVLMSKREGFPNVVLEAASMEVPAVVARSTGSVDAVVDGKTGVVVGAGDAWALALALKDLLTNPEKLDRMGKAARERAVAEFSHAEVLDRHVAFFEGAIHKAERRTSKNY